MYSVDRNLNMAFCGQKGPVTNVQGILRDLDQLEISEDKRQELKECLEFLLDTNLERMSSNGDSSVQTYVNFDEIVIVLIKFAEVTLNILELCQIVTPQWSMICNNIVKMISYVFISDIASLILRKLSRTNALEADFKARCRATNAKVTQCITYMQGLPRPDDLDEGTKKLHLQLMASDVPVHIGLDELLTLGVKITDMLKITDGNNFRNLMEKVQLYCCLATFRELFLLYRFAVQSTFKVDAQAVKHVCDSQRKHDETVLRFLYMPTESTSKFFCQYRGADWPVINSFLERRSLRAESLTELCGAYVQIRSIYFKDRYLCARKSHLNGSQSIRCESNPDDQCSVFQLQGGDNNVFTILPCEHSKPCHVSDKGFRLELSSGVSYTNSGRWCIHKIQADDPNGTPSYMIQLAADEHRYLSVGLIYGQVSAKSITNIGPRFLWNLVNAEEMYFLKLDKRRPKQVNIKNYLHKGNGNAVTGIV